MSKRRECPDRPIKPKGTGYGKSTSPFAGPHEGQRNGKSKKPTPPHGDYEQKFSALTLTSAPDGCSVVNLSYVGDGYCDKIGGYDTAECGWDGGDCCSFTCSPGEFSCGEYGYECASCTAVINPYWVGDGYCDRSGGYNTAECGWDGGDCCSATCTAGQYACGQGGYECECEPTHIIQDPPPTNHGGAGFRIRNGKHRERMLHFVQSNKNINTNSS